jgi:hypothetical protein
VIGFGCLEFAFWHYPANGWLAAVSGFAEVVDFREVLSDKSTEPSGMPSE